MKPAQIQGWCFQTSQKRKTQCQRPTWQDLDGWNCTVKRSYSSWSESYGQLAMAPKALISARKSWYLASVSEGTAGLGTETTACGMTLVGMSPKPDRAEAPVCLLDRAAAVFAACSRLTRTEAGTMAVTVLSSFALGILTTVDCPVKVDWVSFFVFVVADMLGGGPAPHCACIKIAS